MKIKLFSPFILFYIGYLILINIKVVHKLQNINTWLRFTKSRNVQMEEPWSRSWMHVSSFLRKGDFVFA